MTPSEFMEKYRAMTIYLGDGRNKMVDVHTYMWNKPGKHSAEKALAMWSKIKRRLERKASSSRQTVTARSVPVAPAQSPSQRMVGVMRLAGRAMNSPMGMLAGALSGLVEGLMESDPMGEIRAAGRPLRFVPYGKGSPEMVAKYLKLALRAEVTMPATLQQFCDDRYVGIDCSGFVSNYIASIGKMDKTKVGDYNAASYAVGKPKRMSLDSLSNLDILVWADGGHVAIMEEPTDGVKGKQAMVVESNAARGLGAEMYTFESVDKSGMFTVKRANGSTHKVRIFDWDLDG